MPLPPASPHKFTPMADTSNSVLLPGVQTDAMIGTQVVPPDLKPIMASGDMTATLFPLADPLPPQPPPLMVDAASVALPMDAMVQGLPQLDVQLPEPPQFPEVPPSPDAPMPGLESLGEPLPTSVPFAQRAWPPFLQQYPMPGMGMMPQMQPPMPASMPAYPQLPQLMFPMAEQPAALPAVLEAMLPQPAQLPMITGATAPQALTLPPVTEALTSASMTTFPPVPPSVTPALVDTPQPGSAIFPPTAIPEPFAFPQVVSQDVQALPAPVASEPIALALQSGWDALLKVVTGQGDIEQKQQRFADERGRLRAPVPQFADGKVLWEQVWGAG